MDKIALLFNMDYMKCIRNKYDILILVLVFLVTYTVSIFHKNFKPDSYNYFEYFIRFALSIVVTFVVSAAFSIIGYIAVVFSIIFFFLWLPKNIQESIERNRKHKEAYEKSKRR